MALSTTPSTPPPSRAYMADMKVLAAEDEAYFYPGVLVT